MYEALLALALLAAPPLPAMPTPTATPPAPDEIEDDGEDDGEDDEDGDLSEYRQRPPVQPESGSQMPEMAITPSFGFGVFVGRADTDRASAGPHFWVGGLIHPAPSDIGPFMGVGVSLDGDYDGTVMTWYGTAEMRYGVAFLRDSHRYEAALFPVFSLYAIGGWHPEPGTAGRYRVGGGIASPVLFAVTVSETCVPIPSAIELVVDAPDGDFSGDDARTSFRAASQF